MRVGISRDLGVAFLLFLGAVWRLTWPAEVETDSAAVRVARDVAVRGATRRSVSWVCGDPCLDCPRSTHSSVGMRQERALSASVSKVPHMREQERSRRRGRALTLLVAQFTQVEFPDAGPLNDARRARSGERDRRRGEGSDSSDDER